MEINHKWVDDEEKASIFNCKLPFFNNFGDNYRVIVSADGYYDAGFVPVPLTPAHPTKLGLMLLPKKLVQFGERKMG
jgi:hypothetical protein